MFVCFFSVERLKPRNWTWPSFIENSQDDHAEPKAQRICCSSSETWKWKFDSKTPRLRDSERPWYHLISTLKQPLWQYVTICSNMFDSFDVQSEAHEISVWKFHVLSPSSFVGPRIRLWTAVAQTASTLAFKKVLSSSWSHLWCHRSS